MKQKPTTEKDERQQPPPPQQHSPNKQKSSEQCQTEKVITLTPPTHETTENEDSISEYNDQHSHCTEADADEAPHHEEEERTQAQHSRRQRRRDTRDAVIGTNNSEQYSHRADADADEALHHNEEEEEWTQVQHSRRQRRRDTRDAVIGTNNSAGEIRAAEKRAWLYVGKLEKSTMAENVIAYMSKRGIQGNIECDELKTLGDKKAFKVGLPYASLNTVSKPEFWSTGILMRRFCLSRRQ
jgi:hypothetical protein